MQWGDGESGEKLMSLAMALGMIAAPPVYTDQPGVAQAPTPDRPESRVLQVLEARDPAFARAIADPLVEGVVRDTIRAALEGPAGGAVGWEWVDLTEIEWLPEIPGAGTVPTQGSMEQLTESQFEGIEAALSVASLEIAPLAAPTCGAGAYRVLYSVAFDTRIFARCFWGVGIHVPSPALVGSGSSLPGGTSAGVCPYNTRGRVLWEGGSYSERWSTYRGPTTQTTCWYFPAVGNIYISRVSVVSCTGTCPV